MVPFMMSSKNIAVIGGGPAGLIAAEKLAEAGCSVTVYDSKPSVGRKLLLAGAHGGLNLTHSEPLESFLMRYGRSQPFIEKSIRNFSPDALCEWAHGLGQETFTGTSGRVFLKEMQSKGLLRACLARLREKNVRFVLSYTWQGWDQDGALLFLDKEGQEARVLCDACLLALGGASWPRTGSDGSWYEILEREGVPLAPLEPANCGFIVPWSPYIARRFAGEPLKPVIVSFGGRSIQGEITITEKGIEGSVIYALSGALREKIAQDGRATLFLDLRPGLDHGELVARLETPRKAQSFSNFLRKSAGLTPLCNALLREVVPPEELPVHDVQALARLIKSLPLTVTSTSSLERAISTAGGVSFDALDEFFMLKSKPGIFVAGEMMDWEAPTGGYLLQGVFSTALHAAEGITQYLALR